MELIDIPFSLSRGLLDRIGQSKKKKKWHVTRVTRAMITWFWYVDVWCHVMWYTISCHQSRPLLWALITVIYPVVIAIIDSPQCDVLWIDLCIVNCGSSQSTAKSLGWAGGSKTMRKLTAVFIHCDSSEPLAVAQMDADGKLRVHRSPLIDLLFFT